MQATTPTNTDQLVLLVDDDKPLLEMAKHIFEFRGHRVILASDFEESARAIHEHKEPMWAFVDLNLKQTQGDNSGAAILRYIRTVAHHRVAAGAWTGEENKVKWTEALQAGALFVLPKSHEDPEYLALHVEESVLLHLVCEVATDGLTGLYSFREFCHNVWKDLKHMRERGQSDVSSMIAIDLNNFKRINDQYNHREGDRVLQYVAKVFRKRARTYDHIGRRSGDEFLIYQPGARWREAETTAIECQQELSEHPFRAEDGSLISVEFTFGIAQIMRREFKNVTGDRELGLVVDQLIDDADHGERVRKKRR